MLWLVFALMTLAVLAALLLPLLAGGGRAAARRQHDIAVYRAQLDELEGDAARGLVGPAEAAAARLEIQRRLLRAGADAGPEGEVPPPAAPRARLAALAVAVLVPAVAAAFYAFLGTPGLPGQPLASRTAPSLEGPPPTEMARLIERLAERLKSDAGDLEGWVLLARARMTLRRYDEAEAAFARAAALDPEDPALPVAQGEAATFAADGVVTPAAAAAFHRALALDSGHPAARYYLALARAQAGDLQDAFDGWLALAADTPADAPWRPTLEARLRETARSLGVDLAQVMPKPAAAAPPLEGADAAAVARLDPGQREAMIRGMVERLADRLKGNPDDFDGWMRLGRARSVLAEHVAARDAYAQAVRLKPDDVEALTRFGLAAVNAAPDGAPPPEAIAAFRKVLVLAPESPDALWFVGRAEAEAGRREAALGHWRQLLAQLPPDSPEHVQVQRSIAELERQP
jgi:cytochrome c-type biogenesis protein CcmH